MKTALALVLLAGVNSCIGNLLVKYSRMVAPPGAGLVEKLVSVYFIGGVLFYVINLVLFAKALDVMPVFIAYPILAASGFVLLGVASAWLFGESFTVLQGVGVALIVGGIALLAR